MTQRPFLSAATALIEKGEKERVKPSLVVYKVTTSHKDSGGNDIYQLFARLCFKVCNAATATAMNEAVGDGGADTVAAGLQGL